MVEDEGVDGRQMTRSVLGELAGVWACIWQEAADMQAENPGVRRLAEAKSDDAEQAIVELMPQLMLLHPRIVASVLAFCRSVEAEFGYDAAGIAVTGVCLDAVEDEQQFGDDGERDVRRESVGGGQQQDRAVEDRMQRLEDWHADLEDEVARLREVVAAIGAAAAQAIRPTNTP